MDRGLGSNQAAVELRKTTAYITLKQLALSKYTTETYDYPDARSVESMITLSKYRGYQVGFNYAEAFQLVFSRYRKNR